MYKDYYSTVIFAKKRAEYECNMKKEKRFITQPCQACDNN